MKIRDVLRTKGPEIHTVQATESVAGVLKRFADAKVRCLVVTEAEQLIGLLTLRDVVTYVDRHGPAGLDGKVEEAMTRDVTSVTPEASVDEAEALFLEKGFHHLPVEEEGRLVGLVTPPDVLGRHLEDVQQASELLLNYCSGGSY